jgi:hypothetical protein
MPIPLLRSYIENILRSLKRRDPLMTPPGPARARENPYARISPPHPSLKLASTDWTLCYPIANYTRRQLLSRARKHSTHERNMNVVRGWSLRGGKNKKLSTRHVRPRVGIEDKG